MRRIILLSIIVLAGWVSAATALTIPSKAANYVNDYAHILSPQVVTALNQRLRAFDQKTSDQIVVATFPSLDGQNLEETSMKIASQWKIGSKQHDNVNFLLT